MITDHRRHSQSSQPWPPAARRTLAAFGAAVAIVAVVSARQSDPRATQVDAVFSRWTAQTPGCAVGVSAAGRPVLAKAYGMADLEHDAPNGPDTIFEAGSVSKQFTAAAVLLLAKDGKLSLDDPVRKYVPELPDYNVPLTIRHMLTHTSGLRDWGSVAAIAGWPRTTRVHTHAHVLDIASRQKSLNFPPGTRYSYSNTGYNLAAVIVSRVSGQTFAEFTRARIFTPLGMTHSSWRDDFTRVVKGRAIAYSERRGEFQTDMPFENVHGNGGLLTTVGDLLRWTSNFATPVVGDAAFIQAQQERGRFTNGEQHGYALGLQIGEYRGIAEVGHGGATAGYRAHLVTYPSQKLSVAVLCNVSSGAATEYARRVSDIFLTGATTTAANPGPGRDGAAARQESANGSKPLSDYAGEYVSDEAEVVFRVVVEGDALVLRRRPDASIRLTPAGGEAFRGSVGTITFHRDAAGAVSAFSVQQDRVWDLRFSRR